jgi:hypothetical protein
MLRFAPLLCLVACAHPGAQTAPTAPAAASPPPAIAPDPAFAPLHELLGRWRGEDLARHEIGEFSLKPELGGRVLVRRNRDDSPQGHHEDVMIIFSAPTGLRASYFDNEGHVINYTITAAPGHIELVSDDASNQPRFRLTYDVHGSDELTVDFAIALPGSLDFKHFTGGTVRRVR